MRILHVIPAIAARYGGPSQAVIELCQAQRQHGIDVEICTTDADGPGRLPVELGKLVVYQDVPCHFFRCDWSEKFMYSRSLKLWLDDNAGNYDLVHVHAVFSHSTQSATRACLRLGVPYIIRPLGCLEPWCIRRKRLRKRIAWHLFLRHALMNAAAIHYTTEQERDGTEPALGLSRGIVVPNGVSEHLLQLTRPPFRPPPTLLALSRIDPKKGLDLLLTAFAQLKADGQLKDWRLVIAGDGKRAYVEELQRLVRGTAAESFVEWPGWLAGDAKFAALTEASLFVLSSHQENFGIGVMEAMACGTPVLISHRVGLAPSVAEAKAGWIVSLDSAGLCRGLVDATRDVRELQTRGVAARNLAAERFTWPRIAADWVTHYNTIVAQSPKPSLAYA